MMLSTYEEAAFALAWTIFLVCEEYTAPRFMLHGYENNLEAVPDMLSRLGIMRAKEMGHEFTSDWQPRRTLSISRHSGEPTLNDLGLGLDFCIHWYVGNSPHSPVAGRRACIDAAVRIGRGVKVDDDYLAEDDRTEAAIDDYWVSRRAAVERVGGEAALFPSENAS